MKPTLYESFYGLTRDPFRLTPDGYSTFSHPSYQKALAFLKYAAYREEGFVMITGRPGTGKTTLINELVSLFDPEKVIIVTLVTTQLEAADLLHMVASYFRVRVASESKSSLLLQIEEFLKHRVGEGKRAILIVDEAQGLHADAIEELRLLSNLTMNDMPMLQIFLLGHEELRDIVARPEFEQLRQRIAAAAHLKPLTLEETFGYIRHRLVKSGWTGDPRIENIAVNLIYHYSGGIPRKINLICGRILLHGSVDETHILYRGDIENVIESLIDESLVEHDVPSFEEILDIASEVQGFLEPEEKPVQQVKAPQDGATQEIRSDPGPEPTDSVTTEGGAPVSLPDDSKLKVALPENDNGIAGGQPAEKKPGESMYRMQEYELTDEHGRQAVPEDIFHTETIDQAEAITSRRQTGPRVILLVTILIGVSALAGVNLVLRYMADVVGDESGRLVDSISARIGEQTEYYENRLAQLAGDANAFSVFIDSANTEGRLAWEKELGRMFPEASRVSLVPYSPGNAGSMKTATADNPSSSEAESIQDNDRAEPIEEQQDLMTEHDVRLVRHVLAPDGNTVVGSIVLVLPADVFESVLDIRERIHGYIELQQRGMNGETHKLAAIGNAAAVSGDPEKILHADEGRWQVAYWAPGGMLWRYRNIDFAYIYNWLTRKFK